MRTLRNILTATLLTATALAGNAGTSVADTLFADSLTIYPLGPVRTLTYHARFLPHKRHDTHLSLYWNHTADSHRRLDVAFPSAIAAAEAPAEVKWAYIRHINNSDSIMSTGTAWVNTASSADGGISLFLRSGHDGAVAEIAGKHDVTAIPVLFDTSADADLALRSDRKTLMSAHVITYQRYTPLATYPGDASGVTETATASSHPAAGIWTYLDRDADASKASVDTRYTLATIPAADGTLTIIALGREPGKDSLTVKGNLSPTQFTGHYDLRWHTADGRILADDTSADIMLDGQVLRLNFPLLKTSVRFRRQNIPQNSGISLHE